VRVDRRAAFALVLATAAASGCGTLFGLDDVTYDFASSSGGGPASVSSSGGSGGAAGGGMGGQGGVGNADLAIADHPKGQALDELGWQTSRDDVVVFAFSLQPVMPMTVQTLTVRIEDITGSTLQTDAHLWLDSGSILRALDGSDVPLADGVAASDALIFSARFVVDAAASYIVTVDVANIDVDDSFALTLEPADVVAEKDGAAVVVGGAVTPAQHRRLGQDLDSGDVRLIHRNAASDTVEERVYHQGIDSWGPSAEILAPTGTVRWVATPPRIRGDLQVAAVLADGNNGPELHALRYDGAAWSLDWATHEVGVIEQRAFDCGGEIASRNVVCVYASSADLRYRELRGQSGWGPESSIPLSDAKWVRLASRPGTNELALAVEDGSSDLWLGVWDGQAWSAPALVATDLNRLDFENFALAYEASGDLLVAWAHPVNQFDGFFTAVKPAGGAVEPAQYQSGLTKPGALALATQGGSDFIAVTHVEHSCGGDDCDNFEAGIWDGDSVEHKSVVVGNIYEPYGSRPGTQPVAAVWTAGVALTVFPRGDTNGVVDWAFWSGGITWSPPQVFAPSPAISGDPVNVQAFDLGVDAALFVLSDEIGQVWAKRWTVADFSDTEGGSPLANVGSGFYRPLAAAVER
jgi:hypothetical protein